MKKNLKKKDKLEKRDLKIISEILNYLTEPKGKSFIKHYLEGNNFFINGELVNRNKLLEIKQKIDKK